MSVRLKSVARTIKFKFITGEKFKVVGKRKMIGLSDGNCRIEESCI